MFDFTGSERGLSTVEGTIDRQAQDLESERLLGWQN